MTAPTLSDVSYPQTDMAKRLQVDGGMSEPERKVKIVKEYPRPDFIAPRTKDDDDRAITVELAFLRDKLRRQNDRIRRLKEEIADEIKMLTAALDDNSAETVDQVKRRISRLRGALEYQGRSDYTLTER